MVLIFSFLTYKTSNCSEYQVKYLNWLAQNLTHGIVITVTFCCYHCYYVISLTMFVYHRDSHEKEGVSHSVCDPVDCSLPGFFVHGILQARIMEWIDISFSRGSSCPRASHTPAYLCFGLRFYPFSFSRQRLMFNLAGSWCITRILCLPNTPSPGSCLKKKLMQVLQSQSIFKTLVWWEVCPHSFLPKRRLPSSGNSSDKGRKSFW